MAAERARGLVIFDSDLNETDKLVTILTEKGKIRAVVHGAKQPKSKLAAGCRLFAWSNFIYYPGKNLAKIAEANLIESFYDIGLDLNKLTLASYALNLIDAVVDENQVDTKLLKLAVYYLTYLSRKNADPYLLTLAFQIKFLYVEGYIPYFKDIDIKEPIYFSIEDGIFSNRKTELTGFLYSISPDEFLLIKKLFKLPINSIKDLKLTPSESSKLVRLVDVFNRFIEFVLGKKINAYRILKELTMFSEENS